MSNASSGSQAAARLNALRQVMAREQVQAYIVFTADPHMSEYLPDYWNSRAWLSGFDGSAGWLAVTADQAALWTDSRYWIQAAKQLDGSGIRLQKYGQPHTPSLQEWLAQHLEAGETAAADGMMLSLRLKEQLSQDLDACGITLRTDLDLVAPIWTDRPALCCEPIYEHAAQYCGATRPEKIAAVRQQLAEQHCDVHLISSLDDIAWMLNLRGSDVPCNPVFLAHLILTPKEAFLCIDPAHLSPDIQSSLNQDGITVLGPGDAHSKLAALCGPQTRLRVDPDRCVWGLLRDLPAQLHTDLNPSQQLKAVKNDAELAHIREAMVQDGVALCRFFSDFEAQLARGERPTELDVAEQLAAWRAADPRFVCESFDTIAGFNGNGAMPHYRATPENHAVIDGDGLLLIDSGGQYLNGTTDITRVMPIGQINAQQRSDFTLVLKCMIALSAAKFPDHLPGPQLDAIARQHLWQAGLDYGHGTGHGVGYFLNVHEGPQVISYLGGGRAHTHLKPGMITSNEPGLYRENQWGIRIENLVHSRHAECNEFGDFLEFETLTLCPIDTRCIEPDMLTPAERAWLNDYHDLVRRKLSPHLEGAAKDWLLDRTIAI